MTAPPPRDTARRPSLRRDIVSAYAAAGAKIGSWVVVSAVVYRLLGPAHFALLALIRGTIGILNYITIGLAPAMIHHASHAEAAPTEAPPDVNRLSYFAPGPDVLSLRRLYSSALLMGCLAFGLGLVLCTAFAAQFERLFVMPGKLDDVPLIVWLLGMGTLFRLLGDVPGAILQVRGRIAEDNSIVAAGDVMWAVLSFVSCWAFQPMDRSIVGVAFCHAGSGAVAFFLRMIGAARETRTYVPRRLMYSTPIIRGLFAYGSMVVLAQLADYLYAPTDYILIDRLLHPSNIAYYAPALQIDAALLLSVTGLSAVLLPHAARAHARGDARTIRRYYVVGTLSSFGLLAVAAVVAWALSPWVFRLWLGNPMPETRRILPLLLVSTVVGGSGAVGRSILLATGRVWPFTVSVLIAGVTNVVCSYAFVRWFGWGLRGIVLGTVVAVVLRAGVWMPWYVLRVLRTGVVLDETPPSPSAVSDV